MNEEEIGVEVKGVGADVIFTPGSSHGVTISLRNPTSQAWTFIVDLWVTDPAWSHAVSHEWQNVAVGAGQTVQISGSVMMPTVEDTYSIHVVVFHAPTNTTVADVTMGNVVIQSGALPATPAVEVLSLTWT